MPIILTFCVFSFIDMFDMLKKKLIPQPQSIFMKGTHLHLTV